VADRTLACDTQEDPAAHSYELYFIYLISRLLGGALCPPPLHTRLPVRILAMTRRTGGYGWSSGVGTCRVHIGHTISPHLIPVASWKGHLMSDTWQTIEQAAVTLGLSVRTVNRHITAGKLESRLFEGRREVRVTLPDAAPALRGSGLVTGQNSGDTSSKAFASNGESVGRSASAVADMVAEATTPRETSESTINFVINGCHQWKSRRGT
jgi:hypothetical protein